MRTAGQGCNDACEAAAGGVSGMQVRSPFPVVESRADSIELSVQS
jgi:hypothetical protein